MDNKDSIVNFIASRLIQYCGFEGILGWGIWHVDSTFWSIEILTLLGASDWYNKSKIVTWTSSLQNSNESLSHDFEGFRLKKGSELSSIYASYFTFNSLYNFGETDVINQTNLKNFTSAACLPF